MLVKAPNPIAIEYGAFTMFCSNVPLFLISNVLSPLLFSTINAGVDTLESEPNTCKLALGVAVPIPTSCDKVSGYKYPLIVFSVHKLSAKEDRFAVTVFVSLSVSVNILEPDSVNDVLVVLSVVIVTTSLASLRVTLVPAASVTVSVVASEPTRFNSTLDPDCAAL